MDIDEVRTAVHRFWEAGFNGRDFEAIRDMFAPGYVNDAALPGTPSGPEGQREVMARLWEAFPDARFDVEHVGLSDGTAICVGTMSGTHRGTLLGVPPSGREVRWAQCHLIDFDGEGRVTRHRAIRDDLGLLRQMGALPG